MNFQLFKTAEINTKVVAPRVGDLVASLRYLVAPSYLADEPERPELRELADALADHFMRMPEDIKLFTSFRSKNPLDVVNSEVVSFKASELRALSDSITESSVELNDRNIRVLIDIVMQAAIYAAWISFTSNNLHALIFGDAEGLAFDELIKTAAEEERGGKVRADRGRNIVRYENVNIDPQNASASQGLAEASLLAYNCAFHAITTSAGMPVAGFHEPRRAGERSQAQILRAHALSMMVHRMDYCDFLSQCIQNHRDVLASGQRPNVSGSPITPNPIYASIIGTVDHGRHRRTFDSDRASPQAAFVLTSLGQSSNVRSALQARDMQNRALVFGKSAKAAKIYGPELSIKGAHKRAGDLFNEDPDALKASYDKILLMGLQQNIFAIKTNGIYFSRYEEVVPVLAKPDVQARVRASMARIISGLPTDAASIYEFAEAAQSLVEKEAPALADLDKDVPAQSASIANNFAKFAAHFLLKLPLHMAPIWAKLDVREALAPIPSINISRQIKIGERTFVLKDVIPYLLNEPGPSVKPGDTVYNLFDLTPTSANTKNLFIVARRNADGDPTAPDIKQLLRAVYSKIASRSAAAIKNSSEGLGRLTEEVSRLNEAGDKDALEAFVSKNQNKAGILETISKASPGELAGLLFQEVLVSVAHAASVAESDVREAANKFVLGQYEESVGVLIRAISESFPAGKYNSESIEQVDSDYNSFSVYEDGKKLGGDKYTMGPGSGRYDHFGNSGATIPSKASAATVSIMYECSEHFKVDQLEREHITSEYANNKKAHEEYISRNYSADPDTYADPTRVEDIEKKHSELTELSKKGAGKADNILNKLGLGVLLSPPKELLFAGDVDEKGATATNAEERAKREAQMAALSKAKKEMLNTVQNFFKTHSKSSIVDLLKQTAKPAGGNFDEFYYDALMVAISRKLYLLFGSDFEETIINRYGRKEVASTAESAETERAGPEGAGADDTGDMGGALEEARLRAEILEEDGAAPGAVFRGQKEDEGSLFEKTQASAEHSAVAGSRMMAQADLVMAKNYISKWSKDISFARAGGLASHSLAGFIAEVLGKKDALGNKELAPEDRESIESHLKKLRLFETPGARARPMSEKLSYKYIPMFAHMKHRARLSIGNQLFYKKSNNALSRLLQSNKESAEASLPLDRKGVVARLMQKSGINFIDPVRMARKLAEGDKIGDSLELAFGRLMTSMGDLLIDEDYNAWEKAALKYINTIYRRRLEGRIDALAIQISDRKFMKEMMTKMLPTVNLGTPAFSPDERARLASIGSGIGKPKSSVSSTAFLNATRSKEFGAVMAKLGVLPGEQESARKIIESSTEYKQAFEFEASTGASAAQALENALTMLGGPALKKEMNRSYLRSIAPRSKYVLEKILAMQSASDKLEAWKRSKEVGKDAGISSTMAKMSIKELFARIKESRDISDALEVSLQESYGSDRDPDLGSPSEVSSIVQDILTIVDGVFGSAEKPEEYVAGMSSAYLDAVDVADSDENDQQAEQLLAYALGSSLASLIDQECSDNLQIGALMHAVIPSDTLAKTFNANEVSTVRALASEFRLDHPKIREMIESATDVKLSKPETILSDKFRDRLSSEGVTPGLRRSIMATESAPMYGSLLSTAKSKIEDVAQRLLSAEANASVLRKATVVASSSVADGGASLLIGKGEAIVAARVVLDSIRADNKVMYQSFADNLDRKISEWVSGFSSKFPRLEQMTSVAIRKGVYPEALSDAEVFDATGASSVPAPLMVLAKVRVDIEKKKQAVSDLRSRISSAPLPGTVDMLSWQIEMKKIEEAAQKEMESAFPLNSAQIITEQMEEASIADDDDKSVDQDELRRREAALDKIKLSVDRLRNRAIKAEKVPNTTRTDATNAATMLFKNLISGRKMAVNAYDSQKLEDINSAITRASADLDSLDKTLIGTGSTSAVARLVAAIDDDSVIDASVYGAKVVTKEKPVIRKFDIGSFEKEIARAKSEIRSISSEAESINDAAKSASASNAMAFVSMFDQASELIFSDASDITRANLVISSLLKDLGSGTEIGEAYLRKSLEDLASNGVSSKRRLPDYIEIAKDLESDTEIEEIDGNLDAFDEERELILKIVGGKTALQQDTIESLTNAMKALSPASRKVAPDADVVEAIEDLKILESALRSRIDLRPEQIELMVSGLRARGIEAGEAPSAEPPPAQSGMIAPEDEEQGLLELDEGDVTEVLPAAQSGAIAPDEPGPVEISDEDIQPIEEQPAEAPAPPATPVYSLTEAHDALHQVVESTSSAAKAAGATGETANKLSTLVGRLGAMLPPTADVAALPAQLHAATETAKAVQALVSSSLRSPTWTAGSELPHMPELDKLVSEVEQIMSPARRASRSLRFVRTGDSWLI